MADKLRFDEIGYWSELKLDIVRKYASAYSTILAKQDLIKGHGYIDAFAGAGSHVSKSSGQMVPGSPLNALAVEPGFRELHFIDLDGARAAELERVTKGDNRVKVHTGDCNRILLEKVFPRFQYKDYRRALCLLDPYGLNVNWEVLRTAGAMKTIEIFYNFMIMDANMNVFLRNPTRVAADQRVRMDAVWGDDSWKTSAYQTEADLFGDDRVTKASNEDIAEAFRVRLRKTAGFAFVPQPIPMRNSKGAVVYYLYFASHSQVGSKIVGEIFDAYRHQGVSDGPQLGD